MVMQGFLSVVSPDCFSPFVSVFLSSVSETCPYPFCLCLPSHTSPFSDSLWLPRACACGLSYPFTRRLAALYVDMTITALSADSASQGWLDLPSCKNLHCSFAVTVQFDLLFFQPLLLGSFHNVHAVYRINFRRFIEVWGQFRPAVEFRLINGVPGTDILIEPIVGLRSYQLKLRGPLDYFDAPPPTCVAPAANRCHGVIGDSYFLQPLKISSAGFDKFQADTDLFLTSHFSCIILSWILRSPSVKASGRGGQPGT